jgi:SET domain-containing protein
MKKIYPSKKIYIKKSYIKSAGRGVFAHNKIKKGEIIETCPLILLSENDPASFFGSKLVSYFFYFGKEKEKIAIALGFGSIYNHSSKPNAKYAISEKERVIVFTATKDISRNEEITFNYRGSDKENKKNPLWFE